MVLWELTTGKRLFRSETDLETLTKVQECRVPPPSSLVADYPDGLEQIVLKALARDPKARFQTAHEFSRALQSYLIKTGKLIGSDEVAAYLRSILQDRIDQRNEQIRRAGEMTGGAGLRSSAPSEAKRIEAAPVRVTTANTPLFDEKVGNQKKRIALAAGVGLVIGLILLGLLTLLGRPSPVAAPTVPSPPQKVLKSISEGPTVEPVPSPTTQTEELMPSKQEAEEVPPPKQEGKQVKGKKKVKKRSQ